MHCVNVPQTTILGSPWPEREVNLVEDKSAWEEMTWDSIWKTVRTTENNPDLHSTSSAIALIMTLTLCS